jgi:hypothetical protein
LRVKVSAGALPTGAIVRAVHTGGQPRESIVAGGVLWVCDQADGTVTPIPAG